MSTEIQQSDSATYGNIFDDRQFVMLFSAIMIMVIGTMMLVFSSAYIKDVQTLRNAPTAVWNFICGTPIDNNITLPLLLTIAIVCYAASIILLIARWWVGFRKQKAKA